MTQLIPRILGHSCRRHVIVLAACIAQVIAVTSMSGQNTPGPKRGFSVTIGYGVSGSDKPGQAEKSMRAAGYDDVDPGSGCGLFGCDSDDYYPKSAQDHQAFPLGIRYRHSTRYSVDIQRLGLGTFKTEGYRINPTGGDDRPSVKRKGWVGMASIARHWERAWLGAGPAIMMTEWRIPERKNVSQLGIAFDGGLILRQGAHVTPVVRGQYWLVGGKPLKSQSGIEAPVAGGEFQIGIGFILTP
jgi:hypothetical protein